MRDFTVTLPSDAMGKLLATLIGETVRLRENAARATALGIPKIAEEDTARAEALSVAIGCLYRAELSRAASKRAAA